MTEEKTKNSSLLALISSMLIFGTIGIFVKYIPLKSDLIAVVRGFTGAFFLFLVAFLSGKRITLSSLLKNPLLLPLSGAFLGINWILLFEAYRYTSVANATLGYYLAPVFVILLSPVFLKEALTAKKIICALISVAGMVFVSGVLSGSLPHKKEIIGILLSVGAAAFYAAVIIMNKKLTHIRAMERTFFQLLSSAVVLIPYSILTGSFSGVTLNVKTVLLLLTVGIIHTGVAYALYFGSMKGLKGQTVAIFSYIDPVFAIILSALVLPDEPLTLHIIIGAVLILGSAFIGESEFNFKRRKS